MPFDALVEEKIQEAMARGDFDDLPGAGRPLDLDGYFAAPEDLRMAWSVLRNAGYRPAEVELLNEIAGLKARLAAAMSDAERTRLRKQLDDKTLSLNLLLEQRRRARRPRRRRSSS